MALLEKNQCRCGQPFKHTVIYAMSRPVPGGLSDEDRLAVYDKQVLLGGQRSTYWCPRCDTTRPNLNRPGF